MDWAAAATSPAASDEPSSRVVVRSIDHGVLVGVVDGLGRGTGAATAAARGAATLEQLAGAPVRHLLRRCHEMLACTHGAAITVARVDARSNTMEWLGVGNVTGVVAQAGDDGCTRDRIRAYGGVVGYRLPPLHSRMFALGPFDTLVLATDGIAPNFDERVDWGHDPQQLADEIVTLPGTDAGDTLALVVRYLGVP